MEFGNVSGVPLDLHEGVPTISLASSSEKLCLCSPAGISVTSLSGIPHDAGSSTPMFTPIPTGSTVLASCAGSPTLAVVADATPGSRRPVTRQSPAKRSASDTRSLSLWLIPDRDDEESVVCPLPASLPPPRAIVAWDTRFSATAAPRLGTAPAPPASLLLRALWIAAGSIYVLAIEPDTTTVTVEATVTIGGDRSPPVLAFARLPSAAASRGARLGTVVRFALLTPGLLTVVKAELVERVAETSGRLALTPRLVVRSTHSLPALRDAQPADGAEYLVDAEARRVIVLHNGRIRVYAWDGGAVIASIAVPADTQHLAVWRSSSLLALSPGTRAIHMYNPILGTLHDTAPLPATVQGPVRQLVPAPTAGALIVRTDGGAAHVDFYAPALLAASSVGARAKRRRTSPTLLLLPRSSSEVAALPTDRWSNVPTGQAPGSAPLDDATFGRVSASSDFVTVTDEPAILAILEAATPDHLVNQLLDRGANRLAAIAVGASEGPVLPEHANALVSACLDALPRVPTNVEALVHLLPMSRVPAVCVLPLLVAHRGTDLDTWALLFAAPPEDTARFRTTVKSRVSLEQAGHLVERAIAVMEGGVGRPLGPLVAWLTVFCDTFGAQLALTQPALLASAHAVVAGVVGQTARLAPLGVQIKEELASARRRAMGKAGAVEFARTNKDYVLEVIEV
mmetsp:Transcript_13883/g.43701  ORF Transcript_13883/g.43701 Transcript_13883/m.43701 type:complete len:683 (-) Transcript_13883:32-2080(-)|eukprot:CAMPEP_0170753726 /NCGR_PEP_ID=MMETSP0437-20130122/12641_1 /TAXON_ID=0 /ORGANISM="Sexangularia sp." /LENGTH=682 /DNA_ID=CAMNT_0011092853 /DNA_START=99 /DNA_END=2150 /DNA_ORIENTATION=+